MPRLESVVLMLLTVSTSLGCDCSKPSTEERKSWTGFFRVFNFSRVALEVVSRAAISVFKVASNCNSSALRESLIVSARILASISRMVCSIMLKDYAVRQNGQD